MLPVNFQEVIKKAFQYQIIAEGELWLDMLGKRNLLAHTYYEALAMECYMLIKQDFTPELKKLIQWLQERNEQEDN